MIKGQQKFNKVVQKYVPVPYLIFSTELTVCENCFFPLQLFFVKRSAIIVVYYYTQWI